MTKKELIELIKDVQDDANVLFGVKEEMINEIRITTTVLNGINFKSTNIVIK